MKGADGGFRKVSGGEKQVGEANDSQLLRGRGLGLHPISRRQLAEGDAVCKKHPKGNEDYLPEHPKEEEKRRGPG